MTQSYSPTVDPCAYIIYYKCISPNHIVKDYLSLQGRQEQTYSASNTTSTCFESVPEKRLGTKYFSSPGKLWM